MNQFLIFGILFLVLFGFSSLVFGEEWKIYELSNATIYPSEQTFRIPYKITNGELEDITIGEFGIEIKVNSIDVGLLEIVIPKNLHYVDVKDISINPFIMINKEEKSFDALESTCDITYFISLSMDSKNIFIGSTTHGNPVELFAVRNQCPDETLGNVLTPKKQLTSGILPENIACKEGLELIFKSSNGNPACVKSTTKTMLVDRGLGYS